MLCESIRHHRRDLALALLRHCKADEQKIEEVIAVILNKERHGFLRSKQHTIATSNSSQSCLRGSEKDKRSNNNKNNSDNSKRRNSINNGNTNNSDSRNNNNNRNSNDNCSGNICSTNNGDKISNAKSNFIKQDNKDITFSDNSNENSIHNHTSNKNEEQNIATDAAALTTFNSSSNNICNSNINMNSNSNNSNNNNNNSNNNNNNNSNNNNKNSNHWSSKSSYDGNNQQSKERNDDYYSNPQDADLQTKYGFSFGNKQSLTSMRQGSESSARPHSSGVHSTHGRRHEPCVKLSSDSDSGHGEGGDKRHHLRNLNVPLNNNNRAKQQQRRQFRQGGNTRTRSGDKNSRTERASTWVKHNKSTRTRKSSKSKTSRELTESDSGQEMHFSFEGDMPAPPQAENWDEEIASSSSHVPPIDPSVRPHKKKSSGFVNDASLSEFIPSVNTVTNDVEDERWTMSSPDIPPVHNSNHKSQPQPQPQQQFQPQPSMEQTHTYNVSGLDHPVPVPPSPYTETNTDEADFNIVSVVPPLVPAHVPSLPGDTENALPRLLQRPSSGCNDAVTSDLDDDFNIEADMFQASLVEKVESESPLCQSDELAQTAILQEVVNRSPVVEGTSIEDEEEILDTLVPEDEKPVTKMTMNLSADEPTDEAAELTTDFSSPDLDEAPAPAITDVFHPQSSPSNSQLDTPNIDVEVVDVEEGNVEGSVNNDTQESTTNDILQNILSQVDEMGERPSEPPKGDVIVAQEAAETKQEELQLEDLRVALESVCVDQSPIPNAVTESQAPSAPQVTEENFTPPVQLSVKTKKKPKKNKKAKARVSMNMQSIEAEAYSLFELAKAVLVEARMRNVTTFSQDVDEVTTNSCVNRRLQLAAFEIGLFALNIHNYSSPNWFSRTYSTYVSWIENQAVEVGSAALRCLNERWEGVLTPAECVQIASRASRSGDSVMRRSAAELALSCLPYAQNLSTVDITQTITLCKEQDTGVLERACSAVENASRQGGVQPELLFHIAREWHYLHEESHKHTAGSENEEWHGRGGVVNVGNLVTQQRLDVVEPYYMTAEQFVQEQMHQQAQEILGRQLPRNLGPDQFTWIYPQYYGPLHHCPLPQQAIHSRRIQNIDSYAVPVNHVPDELNISEIPRYLQNSYRVGVRALEALALRMPDDAPDVKFALAPPMSDDVRWMCALSAQLGPPYLKIFCKIVYNAVTSPYLLHDLALEAARHFALYNPAQLASHLRSPSVSPIVQKALVMYSELVHYELILLNTPGYADFVELLRKARSAFCMAPGGMARFNEILELVRKTYPKKRELWQMIMNGLSKA